MRQTLAMLGVLVSMTLTIHAQRIHMEPEKSDSGSVYFDSVTSMCYWDPRYRQIGMHYGTRSYRAFFSFDVSAIDNYVCNDNYSLTLTTIRS